METLEEKVKRLEEENESLNDIIKTQIKELLDEVERGDELIEDLISKHEELKRNNRKLFMKLKKHDNYENNI